MLIDRDNAIILEQALHHCVPLAARILVSEGSFLANLQRIIRSVTLYQISEQTCLLSKFMGLSLKSSHISVASIQEYPLQKLVWPMVTLHHQLVMLIFLQLLLEI